VTRPSDLAIDGQRRRAIEAPGSLPSAHDALAAASTGRVRVTVVPPPSVGESAMLPEWALAIWRAKQLQARI